MTHAILLKCVKIFQMPAQIERVSGFQHLLHTDSGVAHIFSPRSHMNTRKLMHTQFHIRTNIRLKGAEISCRAWIKQSSEDDIQESMQKIDPSGSFLYTLK